MWIKSHVTRDLVHAIRVPQPQSLVGTFDWQWDFEIRKGDVDVL